MARRKPIVRPLALLVGMGVACNGKSELGFELDVPSEIADQTTWFEVGAFRDASCSALGPLLASGVPTGATTRVAFRRDAPTSPKIGDLPRGPYAFAAVARGEDCSVLATGCTEATLGDTDSVSLPLDVNDPPTGQCSAGTVCEAARCVPKNDNSDPSVGAGCSLTLIGTGPLANPLGGPGSFISAPAIAKTETGFLVTYREVDPAGGGARLTIFPIDKGGGALEPLRPGLPGRCMESNETDGIGLTVTGGDAMIALARAPCGDKPALELLNLKTKPEIGAFVVSPGAVGTRVLLSAGKPAAARQGGNVVAFIDAGIARIATMDATKGISAPNGTFGPASGATGAWVGASERVLAMLAAGPPSGTVVTPPRDAGADSGAPDAGPSDAGSSSDGGVGSSLRLLVVPAATALTEIDATTNKPKAPIEVPGRWGSLAAFGGRVVMMSDGNAPGRSITYRVFDESQEAPVTTGGFAVDGAGEVTTGDVAFDGERIFFASLKQGAISIHAFGDATSTPKALRNVSLGHQSRIAAISSIRDGRVAIAADESRVAVVWTTASVLTSGDPAGGYAVFACTP